MAKSKEQMMEELFVRFKGTGVRRTQLERYITLNKKNVKELLKLEDVFELVEEIKNAKEEKEVKKRGRPHKVEEIEVKIEKRKGRPRNVVTNNIEEEVIKKVRKVLGKTNIKDKDIIDIINVHSDNWKEIELADDDIKYFASCIRDTCKMEKVFDYNKKLEKEYYSKWSKEEELGFVLLNAFEYFEKEFKKAERYQKVKILEHIYRYKKTVEYMDTLAIENYEDREDQLQTVLLEDWLEDYKKPAKLD